MKNLKQQFKEFKDNTPKHIQWILLGAAFVVVIILLALLLGHKSNNTPTEKMNENLSFEVDPQSVDLTSIEVGKTENENITVSVSAPVIIKDIDIKADGIKTTDNCRDGATDLCIIKVIYKPTFVQKETEATLKINWYVESQPELVKTQEVVVKYSSWKKEEPKKVEPVVEKKPVVAQKPVVIEPEEDEEESKKSVERKR